MNAHLESAALFLSAAVTCGLLTMAWIAFARRRQINDQPGQRRLHAVATPRGGGIAIAVVLLGALAGWSIGPGPAPAIAGITLGVALFAGLGMLDDVLAVGAGWKFALQLLAASVLVFGVAQAWGLSWVLWALLVIACAYVVNIWNFMDGSNGLVTLQALLISLALAFWPGQGDPTRLAALVLAGACAGFLPFNFPHARVFLGDVGSHVLGAAVFGLLLVAWREQVVSLAQALLIGSVLLLDSGYTLARRLLSGKRIWQAHRDHLYQYAVRRGHSHARVGLAYAAASAATIAMALLAEGSRSRIVMPGLLIFSWLLGTVVYFGLRQHWLSPATHREHRE